MSEYICGVSIGAPNQYTTFAILERIKNGDQPTIYHLGQLERFEMRTSYVEIAERLCQVNKNLKDTGKSRSMVADITEIGPRGIIETFNGLCFVAKVTITNGLNESRDEKDSALRSVPRITIGSVLYGIFDAGRLKIAEGIPDREILIQEIMGFDFYSKKGEGGDNNLLEAHREKPHDDYVFAVAIAVWYGEARIIPRCRRIDGSSTWIELQQARKSSGQREEADFQCSVIA